jgi:hypothetical protein
MAAKKKSKDEAIKTWTIDDKEYNIADLSEGAKSQIVNLRVVDQEMAQLKQQLAIMQTARNAYGSALNVEIAEKKTKAKAKTKAKKH